MSFIVEDDFLGRKIDLLGRLTIPEPVAILAPITPFTVFTTNNSQWPSGGGKTFVAYATVELVGVTTIAAAAAVQFHFGVTAWCSVVDIAAVGNPVTVYAGTGFASEADLTLQPGVIANGIDFTITLTWAAPGDVVVSAYGWSEN